MASIEPGKEQLKLIEVIDTKGKGILSGILGLSRTFSVADGFSIEVFRGEKNGERHIGSLLSKNALVASEVKNSCESMGIRNDDLLLRVSLGGKLITMTGTFTTNDQYQPGYKIVLELAVVNPKQFALRHRQQDDPIGIALAALEGEIRLYGSLRNYDKLKRDDLRYRIGHTLNTGNNKDIGLNVVRVHNVEILMDPHKQEELKAKREAQVEATKVIETGKVDAIKAQLEQRRKASDAQFNREEHAKDREVKAQDLDEERLQDLLNAAAEEMKQALLQRIREERESGVSFTEILTTHPELQGIYGPPPSQRHRPDIAPPQPSGLLGREGHADAETYAGEVFDGIAETDTASPRGTSRQKLEGFSAAEIGITFIPTTLTEGQRSIARQIGSMEPEAFVVYAVNPNSPAAIARMMVGDVVVKVNEQIVSSVNTLADALSLRNQAGQISLHVLRGEQGMIVYVNANI